MLEDRINLGAQSGCVQNVYSVAARHAATRVNIHVQQCWRLAWRQVELVGAKIQTTREIRPLIIAVRFGISRGPDSGNSECHGYSHE